MVGCDGCRCSFSSGAGNAEPILCHQWVDFDWPGTYCLGNLQPTEEQIMMDLRMDGRDVCVRLRDDVWQMEEPGTLCLTRDQAYFLRAHLNALGHSYFDEPEDG